MSRLNFAWRVCALSLGLGALAAACDSPPPDQLFENTVSNIEGDAGSDDDEPSTDANKSRTMRCDPAVASDVLRPRPNVMTRPTTASNREVPIGDLFELFRSQCQGCHVDTNLGGFQANRQDFAEKVTELALQRVRSVDRAMAMPPPGAAGKLFSERNAADPLVEFANLLEAWLKAGRPKDAFAAVTQGSAKQTPFSLSKQAGMQLTNLGDCIPSRAGFGAEKFRSAELDKMFEEATELPERLEQTDLFALDSTTLAQHGTVAFAPAYTLWADNAKKIRMVRVPGGQKIKFNKATQSFDIPPNTRFYKTFLKKVIDRDGNERYRKMETRLILARPDSEDPSKSGLERHTALFGTYAWNEQETEAVLVRDPLRNGKPFRDRLVTYYLNEQKVEEITERGITVQQSLAEDAAHADGGVPEALTRTYAIPGSERCIHCHMGAPSKSFVLGFTPLQLRRRPKGEGGVIEPAERDELNQLERLIDYGVIEGMASPKDVVLLEDSQGERKPRNDYELEAQGYMMGNCAHCHNPRGFPSDVSPELVEVLNFRPDSDKGGIFQFPLERTSPRIFRGLNQEVPIPYITPSLFDLYSSGYGPEHQDRWKVLACQTASGDVANLPDLAPWRSLIYRNVDAPFSYSEDNTIFPHMPRDTPGYDCRSRQILGRWMTSIPAKVRPSKLIIPSASEPAAFGSGTGLDFAPGAYEEAFSDEAQPYVEVSAADPLYSRYADSAASRVFHFETAPRFNQCPSSELDVVDPAVVSGRRLFPVLEPSSTVDEGGLSCGTINGVVPQRPHWFVTDLTDAPGDWEPRRTDWKDILYDRQVAHNETLTTVELKRPDNERRTVRLLTGRDPWNSANPYRDGKGIKLTEELRSMALAEFPLGVWTAQCELPGSKTAAEYSQHYAWLKNDGVATDAPIYAVSPGAQIFTSICANCHGPLADSRGRMADTVADLTGGGTRVANLRDGFFGPTPDPGAARERVFGPWAQADGLDADDWAVRYLLWMGLGGTQRYLPPPVLSIIANTSVLGKARKLPPGTIVDANMLGVAELMCAAALPAAGAVEFEVTTGALKASDDPLKPSVLVARTGDPEMWTSLCSLDNRMPVRVVQFVLGRSSKRFQVASLRQTATDYDGVATDSGRGALFAGDSNAVLVPREEYGQGIPVGDHSGRVRPTLDDANLAPWCLLSTPLAESEREAERAELEATALASYRSEFMQRRVGVDASEPPICPDSVKRAMGASAEQLKSRFGHVAITDWIRRGAMNAGMSVFVYLDALAKGTVQRPQEFNKCPANAGSK